MVIIMSQSYGRVTLSVVIFVGRLKCNCVNLHNLFVLCIMLSFFVRSWQMMTSHNFS